MINSNFIKKTQSTNALLWEMSKKERLPEGYVVCTDFQTAGKGQTGNSWESETGKNLLFSMILYPNQVPVNQLFLISQLVSIAIKQVLDAFTDHIYVKWPNDIYWNEKKLGGILIENSLQGNKTKAVVIGIGLNLNQKVFVSDAPNPVSLKQITGKSLNRKHLLNLICRNILKLYGEINVEKIHSEYAQSLYRNDGFYNFKADNLCFNARIITVHPDGQMELETDSGERKGFYFKEVQYQ
jgi:BirA family biotin operon repressor/biotin-[acetyl-CoA-carboxylase] ligase